MEEYKCKICMNYLISPCVCENGHDICINCTAKTKNCPFCRSSKRWGNLPLYRQMDKLNNIKCLHEECDVVGRLFEMDNHVLYCKFRSVNCPKKNCEWCNKYTLLTDHVIEVHSNEIKSVHNMQHDDYFTYIEKYLVHVVIDFTSLDNFVFRFYCVNDADFLTNKVVVLCLGSSAFASRRLVPYLEVTVSRYLYDTSFEDQRELRIC